MEGKTRPSFFGGSTTGRGPQETMDTKAFGHAHSPTTGREERKVEEKQQATSNNHLGVIAIVLSLVLPAFFTVPIVIFISNKVKPGDMKVRRQVNMAFIIIGLRVILFIIGIFLLMTTVR